MGHEETFERDLDDDETLLRELLALAGKVASRLRADGYRARTVTMKVRLATFATLTRSKTLADATDVGADLYHTVAGLYRALPGERRRVPAARACRRAASCPPAPSSSPCSAGSAGATWSGPSIGSSVGSGGARRCRPHSWTDRAATAPEIDGPHRRR